MRNVVAQRAQHRGVGKLNGILLLTQSCDIYSREKARGDVPKITLYTGDLTREEEILIPAKLERGL
jgi:hypothetical protein